MQSSGDGGDDQIELFLSSKKTVCIFKKETAAVEKPPLTATRWSQFKGTVQPQEVQKLYLRNINIGHCHMALFDFIVQCNNMTRLSINEIQDNTSDRYIVTGLTKALPRLNKLKEIDIWDFNMRSEGSKVISSVNSPDLRILTLIRTGLSGAGSSLTSALHRFPRLSYLDLFDSGLTKDESLTVLNTLPSSCPNIVFLSIHPAKFTSEETKPVCKLKKLINIELNFETIEDWLRALAQFPQPLEMIHQRSHMKMGNELNRFLAMISSYTKLRYLVVNEDVLNYEGEDKVSKVIAKKGGSLVVYKDPNSQGWTEYKDHMTKLRNDCMSS